MDPFAQEPDGSDAEWAFLVNDMPWETYKRRYPNSQMASFTEDELSALGTDTQHWVSGDEGAGRAVRVAEYYRWRRTTSAGCCWTTGRTVTTMRFPRADGAGRARRPAARRKRSRRCIGR
jgi:hypothetical protein